MNLTQLPYIISIAGTGSLSGASRELGVSQSTLSRYLSDLEQEVGAELFFTVKKKMYPTQAGRKYIQCARQILEVMESTKNDIANLSRPVRELRLGISPHGGARLLGNAYFAFNRRFPSTRIVVKEGYTNELAQLLQQGELDIFIGSDAGEIPGLTFHPSNRGGEVVLALPQVQVGQYPQLAGKPSGSVTAPLGDFRTAVFVLSDERAALRTCSDILLERANIRPQVVFTSPNYTVLRRMVVMGVGASLLSCRHVEGESGIYVVHLQDTVYMQGGTYVRSDRPMTQEERYLTFLSFYDAIERDPRSSDFIWNEFNRSLVTEFAPDMAMQLDLEVPK